MNRKEKAIPKRKKNNKKKLKCLKNPERPTKVFD